MAIRISRGNSDAGLDRIVEALRPYEASSPAARIELYRQNKVSVRIRIIDPNFDGKSRVERNRTIWRYLDVLPEETQSDISFLILLTPDEQSRSLANIEFEDPIPTGL